MKLSLILEAIDRGADRALDRLRRSTRDLGRDTTRTGRDIDRGGRDMDRMSRAARALDRAGRRVGQGIADGARRGIRALLDLERRMRISRETMGRLAYRAGGFIGGTIRSGLMAGTAIAGIGLTAAIHQVVTAGLTFEKFKTQLEGLEGSAAAGQRAFSWVSNFAAQTPYELTEVMEAFIALKSYGIDPTDGTLRSLGDTAAGMGKGLMQAVEMIADAQTGEFERIKEFGIKAGVQGDKVTFKWNRNGKEMSKTTKQSASEIKAALLGIMDSQFAGGMERLARTTAGKWSNLMDTMSQNANRVWEAGFGTSINKQMDRLSAWIAEKEKDGSLKKWADEAGDSLATMVERGGELARDIPWADIAAGVGAIAGAAADAAAWLGRAVKAVREYRYEQARSMLERESQGWFVSDERRGQIRQQIDALDRQYGVKKDVPWDGKPLRGGVKGDWEARAMPGRWNEVAKSGVRTPSALARPAPQPRIPLKPQPAAPAPKGKITLDIRTPQGTQARPAKIAATGVDIEVNTGRAMGSFA